jgi:hypothetical protein
MNNRALKAAVLVIALIIVAWGFLGRWGSDERRIKREVKNLQELVTKNIGEGDLTSLNRAREITEIFADPFDFEAEQFDFRSRDRQSLAVGIHSYRSRAESIGMRVRDWQLDVDKPSLRATLNVTTDFVTSFRDITGREAYRWRVNWVEQEGEWRIDYVRLLEVIEEPTWGF